MRFDWHHVPAFRLTWLFCLHFSLSWKPFFFFAVAASSNVIYLTQHCLTFFSVAVVCLVCLEKLSSDSVLCCKFSILLFLSFNFIRWQKKKDFLNCLLETFSEQINRSRFSPLEKDQQPVQWITISNSLRCQCHLVMRLSSSLCFILWILKYLLINIFTHPAVKHIHYNLSN